MKLKFYDKLLREAPGEPGGGTPAAPDQSQQTPAAPAGPDLSFIPQDFHVDGKPDLTKFQSHYQEIIARDAQRAEAEAAAKALVPEGDYAFSLPEDLSFDGIDLPEGVKPELDLDNEGMKPLLGDLSGLLKSINAPADTSAKLMGLLAKHQAVQLADAIKAQKADMAALGTPAQVEARVSVISRALETRLPAEQAAALKAMTSSAKAIQALEALLKPGGISPPTPVPKTVQDDLDAYYKTPSR